MVTFDCQRMAEVQKYFVDKKRYQIEYIFNGNNVMFNSYWCYS